MKTKTKTTKRARGNHCACCGKSDHIDGDYCDKCWTEIVVPACDHVGKLKPDDADTMMWHGWAIRAAFIAGAAMQMKKSSNQ